jgi:hypothetical protein
MTRKNPQRNKMNLETILKNIDDAERLAAIDPNEPQYTRTRAGIEAAIKGAKERLLKLKNEYSATVQQNGVAIFLQGPADKVREFTNLVNEMGEAVTIDAEELYAEHFLPVLEASIGPSRAWNSNQVAIMHRLLAEVSKGLGVYLTRAMRLPADATLATKQDTLNFIRQTIRTELGDEFNSQYLKRALAREGLKIRYMGLVAPVIITNASPEEAVGLGQMFGRGKATVTITDEDKVNKEFIAATFKNVQKQIKKK